MSKKGYIKFHRQIQDNWIWKDKEPFDMRSAWLDLLLMVNHEDKKILFEGDVITVKRGQVVTSILKLSEKWKWSRKKTKKFLALLEKDKMVTTVCTTHGTTITIVNWDNYQLVGTTEEQQTEQAGYNGGTTGVQRGYINNNEEEYIKNEKNNDYSAHFEEVWKIYPKKKEKASAYKCYLARLNSGFSEDELLTATKNYAEECRKEERPVKYIKNGSTFFGANTPFIDYLKTNSDDPTSDDYVDENTQHRRDKYAELEKYYLGEV